MDAEIRRFLARCQASGLAPATIRSYTTRLRDFARSVDKAAADVTTEDVEDYLDVECAHLKLSSKGTALSGLSAFFTYLHGRGKIPQNPTAFVKLAKRPRQRPTYYTPEQAARLIRAGTDPRNRLLVRLALCHGQRCGSIVRLRWADIDFTRATVAYGAWKSTRPLTLPLDVDSARALKAWQALHPDAEWVFTGNKGQHLSYAAARDAIKAQCKAAGLPYRGSHELRRTCITTLLQAGHPLHIVSKHIAGHSSVSTTVSHYAGADDADVAAAIRSLPY